MNLKNWPWWRDRPINLQHTRQHLKEQLAHCECEDPGHISLLLLQHALQQPKSWILSHTEYHLTHQEQHTLQESTAQYLQGIPLPYILGSWAFYGRTFQVTPAVLIPRPETEILVETALKHAKKRPDPLIVDVGTGSGVIAVSLAAELPAATVLGVDLSMAALQVARMNALHYQQTRVHWLQSNLLAPFSAQFDLICANLPYIPSESLKSLTVARWEPQLALDGGDSGLDIIEQLLQQARSRLAPKGVIMLEIEASLGAQALSLAQKYFPSAQINRIRDLAGLDRIIEISQG